MRFLPTLILCCAFLAPSRAVHAGPPYLVTEQTFGNVWRIQDTNDDGDALDVGERTLWADGFVQALGLETFGTAVFAIDVDIVGAGSSNDRIIRLADLNADGDALDAGERVVWAAGLNQPFELMADGVSGFYVSEFLENRVLKLADSNGDGDALDVGEQNTFAESLAAATFMLSTQSGLLAGALNTSDVYALNDANGDGDALDTAERVVVMTNGQGPLGALADGSGGFYFSALFDATVYHAQDKNGDGDFLDVAEVLSYADGVFGGLVTPWNMVHYAAGGFLLTDRDAGSVRWVRDVNGDGDALDLGEVTLFADGISGGPWDIVALPSLVPDADFDGDGDVDGVDFLTWQRNYSLTGQIDNTGGDANFDGTVDGDDLAVWEVQYGDASPLSAGVPVPEPSSMVLLGIAILAAIARR